MFGCIPFSSARPYNSKQIQNKKEISIDSTLQSPIALFDHYDFYWTRNDLTIFVRAKIKKVPILLNILIQYFPLL